MFDDGVVWLARLWTDHFKQHAVSPDTAAKRINSAVATMRVVAERTSIHVPTVFAYSPTADNVLGWPYIFMSAIVGNRPEDIGIEFSTQRKPIPLESQPLYDHYARSLAKVHLELSRISFDRIGSLYLDEADNIILGPEVDTNIGPCSSVTEFYLAYVDKALEKVLATRDMYTEDYTLDERLAGIWLARTFLSSAAFSKDDKGPFMLSHRDLFIGNTLVDKVRSSRTYCPARANPLSSRETSSGSSTGMSLFAFRLSFSQPRWKTGVWTLALSIQRGPRGLRPTNAR